MLTGQETGTIWFACQEKGWAGSSAADALPFRFLGLAPADRLMPR
jgi:hypothetical protein